MIELNKENLIEKEENIIEKDINNEQHQDDIIIEGIKNENKDNIEENKDEDNNKNNDKE